MTDTITALRMERQHLAKRAGKAGYDELYRDLSPGYNVYWNGFGDPPTLTYRAGFDDMEYNRERQRTHGLVKGRFVGGNLGWVTPQDLPIFAAAYIKPLTKPSPRQTDLFDLIRREGPITIRQMKEITGMLVKEITPALHRLQEAFLVYEDQNEGQDDRGWYIFEDMFPHIDLQALPRQDALKTLLHRFAYRFVAFDADMVKSYFKLPDKDIKTALAALEEEGVLIHTPQGYILTEDLPLLEKGGDKPPKSVFAMHRNDALVKANDHWLKEEFVHDYPDTLYYLLIDGAFAGVVAGKFRYTPQVEDVILHLPEAEAAALMDEVLVAIHLLCGESNPIVRYCGEEI